MGLHRKAVTTLSSYYYYYINIHIIITPLYYYYLIITPERNWHSVNTNRIESNCVTNEFIADICFIIFVHAIVILFVCPSGLSSIEFLFLHAHTRISIVECNIVHNVAHDFLIEWERGNLPTPTSTNDGKKRTP